MDLEDLDFRDIDHVVICSTPEFDTLVPLR